MQRHSRVLFGRVLGQLESWSRRKRVWANGSFVLINDLHRIVGRHILCDNIRCVHVHTFMSDYLPSTRFFLLPLSNEQMVTVLLKIHNFP